MHEGSSDALCRRCLALRWRLSTVALCGGRVSLVATMRPGCRHGCRLERHQSESVDGFVVGGRPVSGGESLIAGCESQGA